MKFNYIFDDSIKRHLILETLLKAYEFNGDALSDAIPWFFHIFVIPLLVECEKIGQPRLTERRLLNSYAFSLKFSK